MDLQEILDTVRQWHPAVTYGALFFGAFIEYVLPPFPGDTVVLAGAVLVGAFDWSIWPVLAVVTLGAMIGAALDFGIGRWLIKTRRLERLKPEWQVAIGGLVTQFERRGPWYLALNRFVPGVRAFFFVAAGLAGLTLGQVLFWSTLSALAWNGLLVAAGYALGDNIEELEALIGQYNTVMWIVIGAVLVFVGWRVVLTVRRARETNRDLGADSDPDD